jgi:class 3 adenylate cyclase
MRYDGLQGTYWDTQTARVEALVHRIRDGAPPPDGRIVPDRDDLVLGQGRRLRTAVLFLDVSGFSSLPSESVAEQDLLLRALNLFFTEMVRIAEDYGGTVEKNTGDGLMAYFPDEAAASANGATRALAASLTMQAANHLLIAPQFIASGLSPFGFRVGIDTGYVTIARLGAARRYNSIAAVGATANLACKLLALGSAGDVLLGDNAKRDLPIDWQLQWSVPLGVPTGWTFTQSGLAYPAWRFTGRWARLI